MTDEQKQRAFAAARTFIDNTPLANWVSDERLMSLIETISEAIK